MLGEEPGDLLHQSASQLFARLNRAADEHGDPEDARRIWEERVALPPLPPPAAAESAYAGLVRQLLLEMHGEVFAVEYTVARDGFLSQQRNAEAAARRQWAGPAGGAPPSAAVQALMAQQFRARVESAAPIHLIAADAIVMSAGRLDPGGTDRRLDAIGGAILDIAATQDDRTTRDNR